MEFDEKLVFFNLLLFFCWPPTAGEVLQGSGRIHQASALGAQSDQDGGSDRGGVRALLAALLHHQHRQPGGHHPGVQHHRRRLLLHRHPVLRQLLCQPGPLRLPVGQPEAELQTGTGLAIAWSCCLHSAKVEALQEQVQHN